MIGINIPLSHTVAFYKGHLKFDNMYDFSGNEDD